MIATLIFEANISELASLCVFLTLCIVELIADSELFPDVSFLWSNTVTQTPTHKSSELQAELVRLREELSMRDQLVQQLSQELFRLVKGNTDFTPQPEVSERHQAEVRALREQLKGVEQQVTFYQNQLAEKDTEIVTLRQSKKELSDRAEMLEKVVQEMPRIYKDKFAERMIPIKEKIAHIQRENRQLHAELQSVSYRLAVRNRRITHLDLPNFPRVGQVPTALPTASNA